MTVDTDNTETPRFCITPRFGLMSWACCKIIMDVILIPVTAEPLLDIYTFRDFYIIGGLIFAWLTALVIADLVFHAKLIHGLRKNNVECLTGYCKYTKLLWVLILLLISVFTILSISGLSRIIFRYHTYGALLTNMYTMSVGILFQTLMMLLVVNEIKKLNGESKENSSNTRDTVRVYSFGFTVKIETTRTGEKEKNNRENEENNSDNNEETSEKAKLAI